MSNFPHPGLQQGLIALGLDISAATQQTLMDYLALLQKWNHAYNLTAVRGLDDMVVRHLLDSLAIGPYVKGDRILDVGTGAGLPGIPLAICYPARHVTLLDSNGKKCRFLLHAQHALQLSNVSVVHQRAEDFFPNDCFTSVVSRALASLADMFRATRHLVCETGYFLAMKGAYPEKELTELASDAVHCHVYPLSIPTLDAQRHLVCMTMKEDQHG